MKYFTFKNNDTIPLLGLGTWKSKAGEVYGAVREAIKIGYRHIDCAFVYNNEAEIGLAIKDAISDGEVSRKELWVTSKLWNNRHGKDNVLPALQKTLDDLQLDYLDLYLIHWPIPLKENTGAVTGAKCFYPLAERPIENTWQGMELAIKEGLAKHIGVANFTIGKLKDLIAKSNIKPEVNQIELHPYLPQDEMLEFCKQENILLIAYAPLGSRDRVSFMKAKDEPLLLEDLVIIDIANKLGASPAQVLISWSLMRGTSVIPKSVNPERIKQNFEASNIKLSKEDMEKIESIDVNYRFISGKFWTLPGSGHTMESLWGE